EQPPAAEVAERRERHPPPPRRPGEQDDHRPAEGGLRAVAKKCRRHDPGRDDQVHEEARGLDPQERKEQPRAARPELGRVRRRPPARLDEQALLRCARCTRNSPAKLHPTASIRKGSMRSHGSPVARIHRAHSGDRRREVRRLPTCPKVPAPCDLPPPSCCSSPRPAVPRRRAPSGSTTSTPAAVERRSSASTAWWWS